MEGNEGTHPPTERKNTSVQRQSRTWDTLTVVKGDSSQLCSFTAENL